jgi:hypothetical protein
MLKTMKTNLHLVKAYGGGGNDGGNGMNDNERVARLETKVDHIESDIRDIKTDIRDIRMELREFNHRLWSNFLWTTGTFLTLFTGAFGGLALMMAHGFKWI